MIKTLAAALLGTLVLAAAANAQQAQRWPNWYIGIHADTAFIPNESTDLNGTHIGNMSLDQGYGAGASIGYMPGGTTPILDNMRFEFEYNFSDASLDKINGVDISHNQRVNTYMLNAFYDFNFQGGFVPYIGGGVGLANLHLNSDQIGNVNDSDTRFAWQLMAGLGYAPQLAPNTVITLGYKYTTTSDPKYDSPVGRVSSEYDAHNIELGARFAF